VAEYVTLHDDELVDSLAVALFMNFGTDPRNILSDEMNPMSWVPYAADIAARLREDGVVDG
jgi:L-asparaginase/Glu-tRNA(Gln) amidotransferase subunit D